MRACVCFPSSTRPSLIVSPLEISSSFSDIYVDRVRGSLFGRTGTGTYTRGAARDTSHTTAEIRAIVFFSTHRTFIVRIAHIHLVAAVIIPRILGFESSGGPAGRPLYGWWYIHPETGKLQRCVTSCCFSAYIMRRVQGENYSSCVNDVGKSKISPSQYIML